MDWRQIENEKEKYAAYLCSREWSVLKEAVKERSRGNCERCRMLPGNAVHHLTYERKYREDLTDLQHTCKPCHDFTHAKSEWDPAANWRWTAYVGACHRSSLNPVPYRDLTPAGLGEYDKVYVYRFLKTEADRLDDLADQIGMSCEDKGAVSIVRLRCNAFYSAIRCLNHSDEFALGFWVIYDEPKIESEELWDESVKQVAASIGQVTAESSGVF